MEGFYTTVNNKKIYIDDSNGFTAVVIVKYLDFFDTFDVSKFVRITGMRKYYKHKEEFVIVIESDNSAILVENELRKIDFQHTILGNDRYALEQIREGIPLIEKSYYEEPYYEQ